MTSLKDVNFGLNRYCGPAVLSALTGKSSDECAAVISSISGKQEIKAVEMNHLIKALEKLRFDVVKQTAHFYSLFGTLNILISQEGLYIILVPHHVVAVEVKKGKIYLVDNQSKSPLPAEGSARLTQRVDAVYKVIPRGEAKLLRNEIRIVNNLTHLQVMRNKIYEDINDNTSIAIGNIYVSSFGEIKQIINELKQII